MSVVLAGDLRPGDEQKFRFHFAPTNNDMKKTRNFKQQNKNNELQHLHGVAANLFARKWKK
jgi:hypothetical protein